MIGADAANNRRLPVAFGVIAMAAAVLALCLATCRSVAAQPKTPPSPDGTAYLPSISDLMIATIQPRHERLWQAEQNGNWQFAAYEAGNLKGAFTRLAHAHPTQGDISFADMIASVTDQPFIELNSAIQSKDSAAFGKAYADLTDACNSCHQALNHGVVEVRIPDRTSTSDLGAHSTSGN